MTKTPKLIVLATSLVALALIFFAVPNPDIPLATAAGNQDGGHTVAQTAGDGATQYNPEGKPPDGMTDEEFKALLKKLLDDYKACIAKNEEDGIDGAEGCPVPPQVAGWAVCDGRVGDGRPCDAVDPEVIARQVIAKLVLPESTPVFGPDPSVNKFAPGKLVTGFPYWMSVPGEDLLTSQVSAQGLTLRLEARRVRTVYSMGDGTTLTCTQTREWPGARRGIDAKGVPKESPVCGHRYERTGTVTVTGTVYWQIAWYALGVSGTEQRQFSDSVTYDVVALRTRVER